MDAIAYSGCHSDRERLRSYIGRGLWRLRVQEALRGGVVAALLTLTLLAGFLFADRYFSLSKIGVNVWVIWAGVAALSVPYVLWRVFSPRLHQNLAAVLADERLGLHARLCTALTLDLNDPANGAFGEAFYQEAVAKLARLDVTRAFPLRLPRATPFLLLPAALSAGIFYLMPYQDALGLIAKQERKRKAEAQRERVATKLEGRLEDLKRTTGKDAEADAAQYKVKQLLEKAESIAKDLKDGKRDGDEAMVALSALKREIQDQKDKVAEGKEFLDRLEKLKAEQLNLDESDMTREISQALKNADPAQAARELRKLAQKVKDDILNDPNKSDGQKKQELDKLKREIQKLADALSQDEALRDNLRELSEKVMGASDYEALQQEIKKEQERQGKGKDKLGDDIQQQMNDVADELERLEDDNDAALSEDDEKEMESLDEAEDGVDEAMEGLTGEDGAQQGEEQGGQPGQAGQQGQQGQPGGKRAGRKAGGKKSGGKKSGRQGGQSGRQGGQQGGQQGQNQNGKNGRPGNGLGGGKGVGHRPYRDGDAEFKDEKVRGKMQAGAITGLSHFRGQGAKGDAPVDFVNAMTAAEQEANSPLEMERIPNDARDVVKSYFSKVHEGARLPAAPPKSAQPATFDGTKPDVPPAPAAPKTEELKE